MAPRRRDGRPLRAQRDHRAAGRGLTPAPLGALLRLPPHDDRPGDFLEAFAKAGADGCTVHVEVADTTTLLAQMRGLGLRVGLAANPDTPFEALEPHLGAVDLVLCMTVFPVSGASPSCPR